MRFEMSHKIFKSSPVELFSEHDAPDWLTSCNSIRGSTMDNRWFWEDYVLKLKVGGSIDTDFRTITRVQ